MARRLAPAALRVAAALLFLQALVAVGYGVGELASTRAVRMVVGLGGGVLLLAYGIGLAATARGLLRMRRWSRGPAVATQLIHLLLAWSFRTGATGWVGLLLGISALTALVCLVLPSSTTALVHPDDSP